MIYKSSKGEKVEVLWNAMAFEDLALLVIFIINFNKK